MSTRSRQRGRTNTDPTASRYNTKYNQRGGAKNYRPEPRRPYANGDDVHSLTTSIGRHLTTDGVSLRSLSTERALRNGKNQRGSQKSTPIRQAGWWRITVDKAGDIGKQRVMEAIQSACVRPFQPFHYQIEIKSRDGIFFINNQGDAEMIKKLNRKIEVQSVDTLRIVVCRIPAPIPSLDDDLRPHLKDHLLNRRFNQQTLQLDLSRLADDEDLGLLGIFPQLNKQAFIRELVDIINQYIPTTRMIDLGSNDIVSLYEFRNLNLPNLCQISFASNRLKNIDDFDHLKQLPLLAHIYIKNNPLTQQNTKRAPSINDIISTIQKKLPQLQRIDDIGLPAIIRFATDIEPIALPQSLPHCVPAGDMETFLTTFIKTFYQLFDTPGRTELGVCYHDTCMLSLCIATMDNSIVPTRQYKYGPLIYESRNLQKIVDDHRRVTLLRHGKTAVIDFLRIKFPETKHDGSSFHADVISTTNNRAVFTINGLYREVDHTSNSPIRCFQRTFTCAQTAAGILIVADHILLTNATDTQIKSINRPSSQTTPHQNNNSHVVDIENQLVARFSQQSGMNMEYSRLCLQENNWNYDKAAEVFLDLQNKNQIPLAAFNKS